MITLTTQLLSCWVITLINDNCLTTPCPCGVFAHFNKILNELLVFGWARSVSKHAVIAIYWLPCLTVQTHTYSLQTHKCQVTLCADVYVCVSENTLDKILLRSWIFNSSFDRHLSLLRRFFFPSKRSMELHCILLSSILPLTYECVHVGFVCITMAHSEELEAFETQVISQPASHIHTEKRASSLEREKKTTRNHGRNGIVHVLEQESYANEGSLKKLCWFSLLLVLITNFPAWG